MQRFNAKAVSPDNRPHNKFDRSRPRAITSRAASALSFIVSADEKLTAFLELERQLSKATG